MSCMTFFQGDTVIHRLDPRVKILVAVVFSVFVAVSQRFCVLWPALLFAVMPAVIARLPRVPVAKRLLKLNLFMLFLWAVLPVTTAGAAICRVGPLEIRMEGILLASVITLKGNSIVLIYTALLGTTELAGLGHALGHLRMPGKLAHLFLFTVRYIDVLHHEYMRLATAMKARCFRPRVTMHTYRTYGYLVAMLLTKSLEHSERVIEAMKCRGFDGKFRMLDHFAIRRRDVIFGAVSVMILLGLMWGEWS